MPMFEAEGGESFDNIEAFLDHMLRHMRDGEFDVDDVVDAVANMMGAKDNNRHDILVATRTGLILLGEKALAMRIHTAWLHFMKWGMGLNFGIEEGIDITVEQNAKLAQVIAAILAAGGIAATAHGSKIRMTRDNASSETDISDALTQFRAEIDRELGPDAPISGDGWDRWGL